MSGSDGAGYQVHAQLDSRSMWQAKAGLLGEEWQVAALDDPFSPEGPAFAKFLFLRPWTARTNHLSLRDLNTGFVPFPDRLFVLGQAVLLERRFETQVGTPVCRLELTPQQPPLSEVTLSAESLYYAVFHATNGYTVVLSGPPGTVKVPQGIYTVSAAWLSNGAANAYRLADKPLRIIATASTKVVLGGPLTNSVSLVRQGRKLHTNYQLIGADGGSYRLVQEGRGRPPEFSVYHGGKKVQSGTFEFG